MSRSGRLHHAFVRARLLVGAWRLHGEAQSLARGASLPEVQDRLTRARATLGDAAPLDAIWAAGWAGRVGRRLFGRFDTCLVRALVAGSLIRGDAQVAVCIGVYRPWPTGDLLDAHAWLTVDGSEVVASDAGCDLFETVLTVPLHTPS